MGFDPSSTPSLAVGPDPEAKRVAASLDKSVRRVVCAAFADPRRRDPNHDKRCVVLLDGNEHQLEAVQAQARALGIEITISIDLIHVAGYVWAAAKVLRPDEFAERRQWVMEKLTDILCGRAEVVAAAMRRSATMKKLGAAEREPVDDCADYLLKYQPYMRSDGKTLRASSTEDHVQQPDIVVIGAAHVPFVAVL